MKHLKVLLFPLLFSLFSCQKAPETGPIEVTFDRDICERCQMLISDPLYVAEIRGGKNHKIHKFDDIGGAVLWLAKQPQTWQTDPNTEIWVADHITGDWLNAKTAWYVKDAHTPMNYGYGAEPKPSSSAIDYDTMALHILKAPMNHSMTHTK